MAFLPVMRHNKPIVFTCVDAVRLPTFSQVWLMTISSDDRLSGIFLIAIFVSNVSSLLTKIGNPRQTPVDSASEKIFGKNACPERCPENKSPHRVRA